MTNGPSTQESPFTDERPVITIGVRALAEFSREKGGLGSPLYAGISGPEGTRLHQQFQRRAKHWFPDDELHFEEPMSGIFRDITFPFDLSVNGRCDLLAQSPDGKVKIVEVKGYRGHPESLPKQGDPVHLAQAMFYASLFCKKSEKSSLTQWDRGRDPSFDLAVEIDLCYISFDTGEPYFIRTSRRFSELEVFFDRQCASFSKSYGMLFSHRKARDAHNKVASFPYADLREGQKDMMREIIAAIRDKQVLFVSAPTGIGKTMATLYPSIKAQANGLTEQIFYVTPTRSQRKAAEDALVDLRRAGFIQRAITIHAKEHMCLYPSHFCNTLRCPYATTYYERVKDAIHESITLSQITPSLVRELGKKHMLCPYQLSLDLLETCDTIICDYNYIFNPRVRWSNLLDDPSAKYTLLVDEAHNLARRSKEMFSAFLFLDDIVSFRKKCIDASHNLSHQSVPNNDREVSDAVTKETVTNTDPLKSSTISLVDDATPDSFRRRYHLDWKSASEATPHQSGDVSKNESIESAHTQDVQHVLQTLDILIRHLSRFFTLFSDTSDTQEQNYRQISANDRRSDPDNFSNKNKKPQSQGNPLHNKVGNRVNENAPLSDKTIDRKDFDAISFNTKEEKLDAKKAFYEELKPHHPIAAHQFLATRTTPSFLNKDITALIGALTRFFENNLDFPGRESMLIFYFDLLFFQRVTDRYYDDTYITCFRQVGKTNLAVSLLTLDASGHLTDLYYERSPVVFFSATLSPLPYYRSLLDAHASNDHPETIELTSPFPSERRLVVAYEAHSIRYKDRLRTLPDVARLILETIRLRKGHYLVFSPSFSYHRSLVQTLHTLKADDIDWVVQPRNMTESQKNNYLAYFRDTSRTRPLAGLTVIGSLFNEGVDLTGDELTGVMIIGTGLPALSPERNLLRQYFDTKSGNGYEFAYLWPGFNRVTQAAGRLIRSEKDYGIVLLIDDRYKDQTHRALLPHEWHTEHYSDKDAVLSRIKEFWKNFDPPPPNS